MGDADELKQVVLNLCNNAVDAMANGGELILRAPSDDRHAVVEVADTGEGIPPEVDIWVPFMTTKRSGTGLGLTIAEILSWRTRETLTTLVKWAKGRLFDWGSR